MKTSPQSQYLADMETALMNLAGLELGDMEKEQMRSLVRAFFKQEVAMHSPEELQAKFASAEKMIESFKRFLSGQKWSSP